MTSPSTVELRDDLRRRIQRRVDLVVTLGASAATAVQLAPGNGTPVAAALTLALAVVGLFGLLFRVPWTPTAHVALIVVANAIYLATYGPLIGMGAIYVFATAIAVMFMAPAWRWIVVALLAATPAAVGLLFELDVLARVPVFQFDDVAGWQRTTIAAAAAMVATALIVGYTVRGLTVARLDLELTLRRDRAARSEVDRIERELARSRRAELIVELAAEVGADLGAALATIGDRARALTGEVDDDEARACLADVIAAAAGAGDTMRSLTVFNKDATDDDGRCDAGLAARSLPQIVRRTLPDTIGLEISAADELWVGLSASDLLRVLGNLVFNARDAITGSGTISVAVEPDGERVAIEVRDDGSGMDAETAAQIFEPFFTTKPVGRGTGLGLASTRALLERAGGEIRVASEPGRGACFTIRLPRVRPSADHSRRISARAVTRG